MKRIGILTLVLVYILCLTLPGCQDSGMGQSSHNTETTVSVNSETDGTTEATVSETLDFTEETATDITVPKDSLTEAQTGTPLQLGDTGSLHIPYTANLSSVRYITTASDLPDYGELEVYDDAWFQDHALVLIMETVSSGSVEVGIRAIVADGGTATVTLSHETQGKWA